MSHGVSFVTDEEVVVICQLRLQLSAPLEHRLDYYIYTILLHQVSQLKDSFFVCFFVGIMLFDSRYEKIC